MIARWARVSLILAACASGCAEAESIDDPGVPNDGGGTGGTSTGGTSNAGSAGVSGTANTAGAGANGGVGGGTSGSGGNGGSSVLCVPGAQIACACGGGREGFQRCNAQGSGYEACECESASGGAGGSGNAGGSSGDGGVGGSGNTGGSGGNGGSGGVPSGGDACPGALLGFDGAPQRLLGSFAGYTNDYTGGGRCSPSGGGRDVVYRFVAGRSGTFTATITPSGSSAALYYSEGSCAPESTPKCARGINVGDTATLSFAVVGGSTYFLVLDSYTPTTVGTFTLDLEIR